MRIVHILPNLSETLRNSVTQFQEEASNEYRIGKKGH